MKRLSHVHYTSISHKRHSTDMDRKTVPNQSVAHVMYGCSSNDLSVATMAIKGMLNSTLLP